MNARSIEAIRKGLRKFVHSHGVFDERVWRRFGITYLQSQFLFEIEESPGILAKQLVDELRIDKSTASRSLAAMQRGRLVEFRLDARDSRCRGIYLTKAGRSLLARINDMGNKSTLEAFKGMSPAQAAKIEDAMVILGQHLASSLK